MVMGRLVPALARGLDVLELFLDREVLSAPEAVRELGLPRTTVHELLSTLTARGWLVLLEGDAPRYRLGVRAFELGSVYIRSLDVAAAVRGVAEKLAAETGETVQAGVLDDDQVVYIVKVDSIHPVRLVSAVGGRLPAHCTALGKALLSGLPESRLDELFPPGSELPGLTTHSIRDADRLRTALARIRRRGLAVEERESNPDAACVAAGIRDRTGDMVAAMSVSVPTSRWNPARRRELGEAVVAAAQGLSRELGAPTV
jgi:IclR family transcriptional regulator, KDG regulon repressor